MKSVLIIGLGRFGMYMAKKFTELGNHVMALDTDEEKINEILPFVTSAQIGDGTKAAVLESIGIDNFDICVVCVGENFQSSLESTSLLKEAGAKFVLSRASTEIQAKFLLRNGADEVVFAEKEMAERLAVKYSANNIFDYIELTGGYAIFEVPVLKAWEGKSIAEPEVRKRYKINIVAIKNDDMLDPTPMPDYRFKADDHILVIGKSRDVFKLDAKNG